MLILAFLKYDFSSLDLLIQKKRGTENAFMHFESKKIASGCKLQFAAYVMTLH